VAACATGSVAGEGGGEGGGGEETCVGDTVDFQGISSAALQMGECAAAHESHHPSTTGPSVAHFAFICCEVEIGAQSRLVGCNERALFSYNPRQFR
jgi:hypothetical protein